MEKQGHMVNTKHLERTRISVAVRVDLLARIEAHTVQYGGKRQDVVETALLHFFEPHQEQMSLDILSAKLDALLEVMRTLDGVIDTGAAPRQWLGGTEQADPVQTDTIGAGHLPDGLVTDAVPPAIAVEKPPWYGPLVEAPGEPPAEPEVAQRGRMARWLFGPAE